MIPEEHKSKYMFALFPKNLQNASENLIRENPRYISYKMTCVLRRNNLILVHFLKDSRLLVGYILNNYEYHVA